MAMSIATFDDCKTTGKLKCCNPRFVLIVTKISELFSRGMLPNDFMITDMMCCNTSFFEKFSSLCPVAKWTKLRADLTKFVMSKVF